MPKAGLPTTLRCMTLISCLAISACAYHAPQLEIPPGWDAANNAAADEASVPDATWWTHFGSDELNRLVAEAQANNHDLKAAIARILQAEANAKIAGAGLFPSLGGSFNANRTVRENGSLPTTRTTSYTGSLQASYQVDLFGQITNSAWAADAALEANRFAKESTAITLTSQVVTAYLQVLSARERLALADNRLKNAEDILRTLEAQRRVGTLSDLELSQQRSALASQRATLPALRLAERQSLNSLAVLLGRPPQNFTVEAKSLNDIRLPQVAAGIPSTVLFRRPDLRASEATLQSVHYNVNAARAARFPSINLTANGGSASSALQNLFSTGTFFYSLAGSVAETVFAGGRLEGAQQQQEARYREILENYKQSVLAAFQDTENALEAVRQNGEQHGFSQEASTQADEAYRLAVLRYRAGVIDFQTVLNAQNAAFQSQEQVVQAELSRFTAVVSLVLALGGGWDGELPPAPPLPSAPLIGPLHDTN
jgi:multidrug efflux system outer membrane protein